MNIAQTMTAEKKQRIWKNVKDKQPDIAKFIAEVVHAFPGRYRVILVERNES